MTTTLYIRRFLLDLYFGKKALTVPPTLYAALFTAAPTEAGGGTEVAGAGYARVAIPNDAAAFPDASGAALKLNGTTVSFPPTSDTSWGTVNAFGLYDAAVGGNLLVFVPVAPALVIGADNIVFYAAGNLSIAAT
jgi:hypothetical protein